jgi:hypothetical protein
MRIIIFSCLFFSWLLASAQTNSSNDVDDTHLITNAGFEAGSLEGWKHWRTRFSSITKEAYAGNYAAKIGPERAFCVQETKVKGNALYRISAYVKTESGAEEVQLIVSNYGGAPKSVSSSLTAYTKVNIDFQTAYSTDTVSFPKVRPFES